MNVLPSDFPSTPASSSGSGFWAGTGFGLVVGIGFRFIGCNFGGWIGLCVFGGSWLLVGSVVCCGFVGIGFVVGFWVLSRYWFIVVLVVGCGFWAGLGLGFVVLVLGLLCAGWFWVWWFLATGLGFVLGLMLVVSGLGVVVLVGIGFIGFGGGGFWGLYCLHLFCPFRVFEPRLFASHFPSICGV